VAGSTRVTFPAVLTQAGPAGALGEPPAGVSVSGRVGLPPPATAGPADVPGGTALTAGTAPLTGADTAPGTAGVPGIVLAAYRNAEAALAAADPSCGVSWPLLAAIGRIESGHARGGRVDAAGTTLTPILGPQLSGGPGIAAIGDTDRGGLDGDVTWDRAVGPMQFIPSTWARYAADGNRDGVASPHNVHDAALAAAGYLCAGGEDLRTPTGAAAAVLRYNRSQAYVSAVLRLAAAYAGGVAVLPDTSTAGLAAAPVRPGGGPAPAAVPRIGATGPVGPVVRAAPVVPGAPVVPAVPAAPVVPVPPGEWLSWSAGWWSCAGWSLSWRPGESSS